MPNQFLPDPSPQVAPYLVRLLPSRGFQRTEPGGNTPELLGPVWCASGPAPNAHPRRAGLPAAWWGALLPWVSRPRFPPAGNRRPCCRGNAGPKPMAGVGLPPPGKALPCAAEEPQSAGCGPGPRQSWRPGALKAQHYTS